MKKIVALVVVFLLFAGIVRSPGQSLEEHKNTVQAARKKIELRIKGYSKAEAEAFSVAYGAKVCHFFCRVRVWNDSVFGETKIKKIVIIKSFPACFVDYYPTDSSSYVLCVGDYFFRAPISFNVLEVYLAHEMGHIVYDFLPDSVKDKIALIYDAMPPEERKMYNESRYFEGNDKLILLGHAEDGGPHKLFASAFALTNYFLPIVFFEINPYLLRVIKPFAEKRERAFFKTILCEMWY